LSGGFGGAHGGGEGAANREDLVVSVRQINELFAWRVGQRASVVGLPGDERGIGTVGGKFLVPESCGGERGATDQQSAEQRNKKERGETNGRRGSGGVRCCRLPVEDSPHNSHRREQAGRDNLNGACISEAFREQVTAANFGHGAHEGLNKIQSKYVFHEEHSPTGEI
jgi:hypothetical protein